MQSLLLRSTMALRGRLAWRSLERMARRPDAVQQDVLRRLLHANENTTFGRKHRFDGISNHAEFVASVPVQEYETLRAYVDEQRLTGQAALTAESPLFYAQTSGTSGTPKYIPITPSMLEIQRREQALFSYLQYRVCPAAFAGKALGIMGAAVEGNLDSGHAVGSVSGHLYRSLPRALQSRFVVPPEVSSIADYDVRYLTMARLALGERDITYLGSPNPSTLLRLLAIIDTHRERLRRSLETGTLDDIGDLGPEVRLRVSCSIRRDPERASELAGGVPLTYARLWPRISLVTTWTGGSCGIALNKLRTLLPSGAAVMELGYQSTECRGTIAVRPETSEGIPPVHHHFFEFVEQGAWDQGQPVYLTLERLESGRTYYILVTTASGLYRYFMNDLVQVTGWFAATPLLRFVQKGRGVTNLTGEKLYESHVIAAVRDASARLHVLSWFFLLVADENASCYRLFIEFEADAPVALGDLAREVDERLSDLNVEYRSKRDSGRLGPLTAARVRTGTGEAFKAASVRAGQREGQFKPPALVYLKDAVLDLGHYVVA